MSDLERWIANDDGAEVTFGILVDRGGARVSLWANEPTYPGTFTPAAARQAAEEWPAILRRLADIVDAREERL